MFFWLKLPFVRATVLLIAGILLYIHASVAPVYIGICAVVTTFFLWLVHMKKGPFLLRNNVLVALAVMILLVCVGYFATLYRTASNRKDNLTRFDNIGAYVGKISSDPQRAGAYVRCILALEKIKTSTWQNASGQVQIYVKLSENDSLKYGDKVLVNGSPTSVANPRNPNEFNYKKYLATKQLYHQHFVLHKNWYVIGREENINLKRYASQLRHTLETQLERHIADAEALAIIKALVLGNKDDLSDETRSEFAQAGAMHVLAVSGLHVGIIYLILLLIINQMTAGLKKPWLVAAIVIPILWLYAFVTGLSPSVLRAVTMFSLLSVGQAINRRSSPFNSLAVSAFLLLFVDPYLIMSVGFQLSYIAVTGILLLYPVIEPIIKPRFIVLRFLWQITALSIAAQIVTAPLAAYYFHQFPTYFLIANLLAIPLATILVWGGVFMISLGYLPGLGSLLGTLLSFFAQIMKNGIAAINALPYASVADLYPDLIELLILYAMLTGIFIAFIKRSSIAMRTVMFLILLVLIKLGFGQFSRQEKAQIVFYAVNKGWVVDLIAEQEFATIESENITEADLTYAVWPNRKVNKLKLSQKKVVQSSFKAGLGTILVWRGNTILITPRCALPEKAALMFDFVYYTGKVREADCNRNQIHFRKLVKNEAIHEIHALDSQGALVVNL